MTFIEGIGDEVTAFFVVAIVVVLATLVTFIGSGPHTYGPVQTQTPLHTRSVRISVRSGRRLVNARPQTHETPDATNGSDAAGPPYEEMTVDWPRMNLNQNDAAPPETDSTLVEANEDEWEEEHSSSELAENDAPEAEAEPTAPPEDEEPHEEEEQPEGIRVRLKYLDDTERMVRSSPIAKIADFKRCHFSEDLANNRIIRLIFCGHLLRDSSTLASYRVVDNSVVHVQILQAQSEQQLSSAYQEDDLDLSPFLWPLVLSFLVVCWILYVKYPEYFSVVSLSLLSLFTASFFVFYAYVHLT